MTGYPNSKALCVEPENERALLHPFFFTSAASAALVSGFLVVMTRPAEGRLAASG
jgi:hypothetical protein